MKYIDSEKLIAEIERLMNSETRGVALKSIVYKKVFSLITSLQQEQPEVDLEKEIEDYWEKICDDEFGELIPKERETVWFDDIARHFYNLALADVRGEVEKKLKHSRDSQAFSNRESRENGVDCYNSGSIDILMKLEDFIDNLTK